MHIRAITYLPGEKNVECNFFYVVRLTIFKCLQVFLFLEKTVARLKKFFLLLELFNQHNIN